jgi:hypothetical protein
MDKMKNKRWLKWLLIVTGAVIVIVAGFFIVQSIMTGAKYGTKEYNTEASADGVTVKLNSVERLPLTDEKCQERVTVLTASDDEYDCVIANVTVTNTSSKTLDYSYRNFGYLDPRNDQILRTAITLISFEGVDVTKEIAAGESHSQEVHLTLRKNVVLSDLQLVYRVDPNAENGAEIKLQL